MHRKSLQFCWRFKQLGENNYYMNYFGILTILLSHITGALYLQKQKYNKLLTACFWGIYALFSVCLMIFQKNAVYVFWGTLFMQAIFFYLTSIGSVGENLFLFLTYSNSFCICIGANLILSVFLESNSHLYIYTTITVILMHIFLYKFLIPTYRKYKIFFNSGWWKLNIILVFFLIQFVNQYAFSVIERNKARVIAIDFVIFSIIFYSTLILIFDTVKSISLMNKKTYENVELEKIAYIDVLTNMQNRVAYMKHTKRLVFNHRNSNDVSFIFVMMDIDGFKSINDTNGHAAGDEILKRVGSVIKEHFEQFECRSFRIGGDEFVLLFKNIQLSDVENQIRKMNKNLYTLNGITVSYGCCMVDFNDTKPFEEAYKKADTLMYSNKQQKKKEHI